MLLPVTVNTALWANNHVRTHVTAYEGSNYPLTISYEVYPRYWHLPNLTCASRVSFLPTHWCQGTQSLVCWTNHTRSVRECDHWDLVRVSKPPPTWPHPHTLAQSRDTCVTAVRSYANVVPPTLDHIHLCWPGQQPYRGLRPLLRTGLAPVLSGCPAGVIDLGRGCVLQRAQGPVPQWAWGTPCPLRSVCTQVHWNIEKLTVTKWVFMILIQNVYGNSCGY